MCGHWAGDWCSQCIDTGFDTLTFQSPRKFFEMFLHRKCLQLKKSNRKLHGQGTPNNVQRNRWNRDQQLPKRRTKSFQNVCNSQATVDRGLIRSLMAMGLLPISSQAGSSHQHLFPSWQPRPLRFSVITEVKILDRSKFCIHK